MARRQRERQRGIEPAELQPLSGEDHSTSDRDRRLWPRSLGGTRRRLSTTVNGSR
jgi:hypothetical protein